MKSLWLLLAISLMSATGGAQGAPPVLDYQAARCTLSVDQKPVQSQTVPFMTLIVDDHLARFVQIQFGSALNKIQYQLLIEPAGAGTGTFIYLQNLLVAEAETSREFTAPRLRRSYAFNERHQVNCVLTLNLLKK